MFLSWDSLISLVDKTYSCLWIFCTFHQEAFLVSTVIQLHCKHWHSYQWKLDLLAYFWKRGRIRQRSMPFVFGKIKPKITWDLKQRLETGSPVLRVHVCSPNFSPCFEHRAHSRFENVKTNDFMMTLFFGIHLKIPLESMGKSNSCDLSDVF